MTSGPVDPAVRALAAADTAALALGVVVLEARPGYARCALTLEPRHANPHGICHGGVLFTFADSTFGYACNAQGRPALAQGADIDFVRPGRIGDTLIAEAEERARAGRSGIYDVTVATEAGEIVALLRGRSREVGGTVIGDQPSAIHADAANR